ncbi:hypothetical protein BLA29_011489 [Euroglyphus maynei]|uniref:Uncharacterized protein n=1 Tax=Euroglyphus maynei TaxID=6958 RepID=A0A1Y3AXD6_EURMA|nr:hypothetical protein BLA29_011489 [Euroglyphus maynei]
MAVIMAQKFVDNVKNLILQAPYIYHDDRMTEKLKLMRDFSNWDARLRRQYKIIYNNNADRAEKLWQTYVDFMIEKYNDSYPDGLLGPKENGQNNIVCPTAIFIEQCENFRKEFRNGKLIVFESCGHFLQRRASIKFKENFENFILNNN